MSGHHPSHRPFALSVAALLLASALSSLGWVFEGEAISHLAPLPVICASLIISGSTLILLGRITKRTPGTALAPATTAKFFIFSAVRSAAISLLFGYCLTLTSSTKTMFLTKIEPYIVLAIQIIWFGHRTTAAHITLLAIHVAGAIMLSTGGQLTISLDTVGDILLFVAIAGNAALYLPAQHYAHSMGSLFASGFSQLYGGLLLLPFTLATSRAYFTLTPEHLTGWYYTGLTILVFYVISTGLWFFSLKGIPAWLASALRSFGPILAAPIAWVWFDKTLTPIQTAGALIVVLTSAWMVVLESNSRRKPAPPAISPTTCAGS